MSKHQTFVKGSKTFAMTPLRNDCYLPSVQLDLTAPVNLRKPVQINAPVYLNDNKYFTPAFLLSNDKTYYSSNSNYEKSKFEGRVQKALQLHCELQKDLKVDEDLTFVEPSSRFCQICKIAFNSYHEHASSDTHREKLESSIGNGYMLQICNKMRGYLKGEKECGRSRRIKKDKQKRGRNEAPTVKVERQQKQRKGRVPKNTNQSMSTNCFVGNGY